MKILFGHAVPFSLAHGGLQVQILQTKTALEQIGMEVEFLRWWDETQTADLIHFFGRPAPGVIELAHQKGIRFVMSDVLTAQGSRSGTRRCLHRVALRLLERFLPAAFAANLPSHPYSQADASLALTPWEARLMKDVYGAPSEKVYVVPNGVEEVFLNEPERTRGKWLVCTATITPRKRVLELAEAATLAQTPLFLIGKPYSQQDPYFLALQKLAAKHPEWIRYEGSIADRNALSSIYRQARGFVLLSTMESLSLAALEAAACECPLLLSDLPWARISFAEKASYCRMASPRATAHVLRRFYDEAPALPLPPKPLTWKQVGEQIKGIYQDLLSTSR